MSLRSLPKRTWLFALLVTVAFAATYYFVLGRGSSMSSDTQSAQQYTIARAESGNIASFFKLFGNSVALLGQDEGIIEGGASAKDSLNDFLNQWKGSGVIGGVILTDENGKVIENSNITGKPDVGKSLDNRDYFIWAKSQKRPGSYFIGKGVISNVGASKGQAVVVVTSPVFINGVFKGIVGSSVELKPLIDHYLKMMTVSDNTRVYLIGSKGDLLFATSSEGIGSNIFDLSENQPFLGSQKLTDTLHDATSSTRSGEFTLNGSNVAYAPVKLPNRNWLVVMSTPANSISGSDAPIFVRQVSVLALLYLTIMLFGEIVIQQTFGKC